jgi:hypothetical protein
MKLLNFLTQFGCRTVKNRGSIENQAKSRQIKVNQTSSSE